MIEVIVIVILVGLFLLFCVKREEKFAQERLTWAEERRELLNRIKPETAQIPNVDETAIFEPINDDESYWRAHEEQLKDVGSFPYGFDEEVKGR